MSIDRKIGIRNQNLVSTEIKFDNSVENYSVLGVEYDPFEMRKLHIVLWKFQFLSTKHRFI